MLFLYDSIELHALCLGASLRNCLLICCSLASVGALNAQTSVTSYGAVPDGHTDNTAAFAKAFAYATAHPGTKLTFPCSSGDTYLVKSPLVMPSRTTLEGDHAVNCRILYNPAYYPGNVNTAFSFVGSAFVTVHDLNLQTGSAFPPQTITQMGGSPGGAGQHIMQNITIKGYASKALSYAIGSEVDTWRNVFWEYDGGGATYGFYTSGQDDLGICQACKPGSNLSLFFSMNTFVVFGNSVFTAIADKIGGGTGDHYYGQNYIGLNNNAASLGFEFISGEFNQGGPNSVIHVSDTRIENGGYAFYFKKASQGTVYNVAVDNITWDSSVPNSGYFAFGEDGLTLRQFRMSHNIAYQNGTTGRSSVDSLIGSDFAENYGPIAIRNTATDNTLVVHGSGSLAMPSRCSGNALSVGGIWTMR